MLGLLGKITEIETERLGVDTRATVKLVPKVVLPVRHPVPPWLKDQTLTVERIVLDPIEAGKVGDGITLSAGESAKWLDPLSVRPAECRGRLPETIEIELAWWKDETPPACRLAAHGLSTTAKWEQDGGKYRASAATTAFSGLQAPFAIEVVCDDLRASVDVFATDSAAAIETSHGNADYLTLDNDWYRVDITLKSHAAALASLVEHSRGVDHFQAPSDRILTPLEYGGHYDRFSAGGWGWSDELKKAAVASTASWREGGATRVVLDTLADEGKSMRAPVQYTLLDDAPLLLIERQFMRGAAKENKDAAGDAKAQERESFDDVDPFRYGFRSAAVSERNGKDGSRLHLSVGGRLRSVRLAQQMVTGNLRDVRLTDGWALAEHPRRRAYLLYLVDRTSAPMVDVWSGWYEQSVDLSWGLLPLAPGRGVAYATAIAAGEIGGATARGAWIACRSRDGSRCGVVARFEPETTVDVTVTLGLETKTVRMVERALHGVGAIHMALLDFEEARRDDLLEVTVEPAH